MRIDRIEKSKHKQERVLVFLEGGDLLRITGAELLRFGLYKGMDLPPELVVELQAAAQKSELKQTAARMASGQMLSKKEVQWRLKKKGATEQEAETVFLRALHGHRVTQREEDLYITHMLTFLGREYKKRGWVMQLHYNAQRNVNRRQFRLLGPDTGFDCISTNESSSQLSALLNAMEETDSLPRTILYSLSGEENMMIASVAGSFTEPQVRGKVQLGASWWFQDTKAGMEKQLRDVAQSSLLGNFVGMLTDSRSFLSYTRHEYFRRILCGLIGQWVENGEYPDDRETLTSLVRGICCENARAFFGF